VGSGKMIIPVSAMSELLCSIPFVEAV